MDVYLDAVFFPKCVDDVHTFQQEGWHYELNDPSEDISYKGFILQKEYHFRVFFPILFVLVWISSLCLSTTSYTHS